MVQSDEDSRHVTGAQFVAPYPTLMTEDAPQREDSLHEVFNGLRYIVRGVLQWRLMPHDLPPWHTVYQLVGSIHKPNTTAGGASHERHELLHDRHPLQYVGLQSLTGTGVVHGELLRCTNTGTNALATSIATIGFTITPVFVFVNAGDRKTAAIPPPYHVHTSFYAAGRHRTGQHHPRRPHTRRHSPGWPTVSPARRPAEA
jgi:transposase